MVFTYFQETKILGNSSKIPFFADFGHLNTVSNKSSSYEIEEMSFNISNLSIFRTSANYSLIAPAVSPWTNFRWKITYTTIIGSMTMIAPAISSE